MNAHTTHAHTHTHTHTPSTDEQAHTARNIPRPAPTTDHLRACDHAFAHTCLPRRLSTSNTQDPCPSPCPPPPFPGGLPKCSLQSLKDNVVTKYNAVVQRLASLPNGHTLYPSKTVPPTLLDDSTCPPPPPGSQPTCGFTWAASSGWTSGFFPGILWQLANFTGSAAFAAAAPLWTAGRETEKTATNTHDIGSFHPDVEPLDFCSKSCRNTDSCWLLVVYRVHGLWLVRQRHSTRVDKCHIHRRRR
jgi:hypothetical protein